MFCVVIGRGNRNFVFFLGLTLWIECLWCAIIPVVILSALSHVVALLYVGALSFSVHMIMSCTFSGLSVHTVLSVQFHVGSLENKNILSMHPPKKKRSVHSLHFLKRYIDPLLAEVSTGVVRQRKDITKRPNAQVETQ